MRERLDDAIARRDRRHRVAVGLQVALILVQRHRGHARVVALFEEELRAPATLVRDPIPVRRGSDDGRSDDLDLVRQPKRLERRLDDRELEPEALGQVGADQIAQLIQLLQHQLRQEVVAEARFGGGAGRRRMQAGRHVRHVSRRRFHRGHRCHRVSPPRCAWYAARLAWLSSSTASRQSGCAARARSNDWAACEYCPVAACAIPRLKSALSRVPGQLEGPLRTGHVTRLGTRQAQVVLRGREGGLQGQGSLTGASRLGGPPSDQPPVTEVVPAVGGERVLVDDSRELGQRLPAAPQRLEHGAERVSRFRRATGVVHGAVGVAQGQMRQARRPATAAPARRRCARRAGRARGPAPTRRAPCPPPSSGGRRPPAPGSFRATAGPPRPREPPSIQGRFLRG